MELLFVSTGVVVMFSMGEVAVNESDRVVHLTVIKTGANSRNVFVSFTTLDGNALGIAKNPPQFLSQSLLVHTSTQKA